MPTFKVCGRDLLGFSKADGCALAEREASKPLSHSVQIMPYAPS